MASLLEMYVIITPDYKLNSGTNNNIGFRFTYNNGHDDPTRFQAIVPDLPGNQYERYNESRVPFDCGPCEIYKVRAQDIKPIEGRLTITDIQEPQLLETFEIFLNDIHPNDDWKPKSVWLIGHYRRPGNTVDAFYCHSANPWIDRPLHPRNAPTLQLKNLQSNSHTVMVSRIEGIELFLSSNNPTDNLVALEMSYNQFGAVAQLRVRIPGYKDWNQFENKYDWSGDHYSFSINEIQVQSSNSDFNLERMNAFGIRHLKLKLSRNPGQSANDGWIVKNCFVVLKYSIGTLDRPSGKIYWEEDWHYRLLTDPRVARLKIYPSKEPRSVSVQTTPPI